MSLSLTIDDISTTLELRRDVDGAFRWYANGDDMEISAATPEAARAALLDYYSGPMWVDVREQIERAEAE